MRIRILLFTFNALFLILLSACGNSTNSQYSTASTHPAIVTSMTLPPQFSTTVSTKQAVNTNCPKPGTGRAAIMPYSWSNFSRDGSFYTDYTSFGSLNGGPLTPYTTNFNIRPVGWTTM